MTGSVRQKKLLAIVVVGCGFLAWRGYALWARYAAPARAEAALPSPPPQPSASARPDSEAADPSPGRFAEARRMVAEGPWGRNPFASPTTSNRMSDAEPETPAPRPAAKPPSLRFTGVSRSGDNWLAVVNDRIVRVGDEIEPQLRVAEITKQSLTLLSRHWIYRYELGAAEPAVQPVTEEP